MKKLVCCIALLSFTFWHGIGNTCNQPFCTSPTNYIKSSKNATIIKSSPTTMWRTYDVTCINDVKSSFISDRMDPTTELPDYTSYSNGSEIFWNVNNHAELEELNNVIGQPFCKSKMNNKRFA